MSFWLWIGAVVLVIVGVSVFVGRALSRPQAAATKDQRMLALKASGAFKHRKSNRD